MSVAIPKTLANRMQGIHDTLGTVREWIDQPHTHPIRPKDQAALEEVLGDLQTRVGTLLAEPTLLTVVFLGGTGVGKSTLLNALAGASIADSGIARPTTQYATVYHHQDVDPHRLNPAFQACRLVAHDRPELREKILVDTPDIDGNVLEHHDRLKELLPVADAVLYVGSQEKYHDKVGWDLMLSHRAGRGFAFVLNKWDRCLQSQHETTGSSPCDDLRRSLAQAGFPTPMVFRAVANQWARHRLDENQPRPAVEDDFGELEQWLEAGLTERAIRDIKIRGITGMLGDIVTRLNHMIPPDWSLKRRELYRLWETSLRERISEHAQLLAQSADPHSAAFERRFSQLGRGNFRGLFQFYLNMLDQLARLRLSIAHLPASGDDEGMRELARRCVNEIPKQTRSTYVDSLHAHLLAQADSLDWPVITLEKYLPANESEASSFSDVQLAETLTGQLLELEKQFAEPTGGHYALRMVIKVLCDWLPQVVGVLLLVWWLKDTFFTGFWGLHSYVSAGVLMIVTLVALHLMIVKLVPSNWQAVRTRLRKMIEETLLEQVTPAYEKALEDFSASVEAERESGLAVARRAKELQDQLGRLLGGAEQQGLFAQTARSA